MRSLRLRLVVFMLGTTLAGLLLTPARCWGWQDLHPDFVRRQVERIADPKLSAADRRAATWVLVSTGRASVDGLAQLAKTEPRLLWTCVGILDLVRTTAQVVTTFSQLLDRLPGGMKDTGEVRGFLTSRMEDMLGRTFKTAEERRAFVAANEPYLTFDPATMRFLVDEEARTKKQPMLHYPYAPSPHAAAALAFWRLLLAMHLGQTQAVATMLGPEVKLVQEGGKIETRPELDLDAFADPPHNHRALSVRDEGNGLWLIRTGNAYLFFAGDPVKCVRAGLKPIE